MKLTQKAVTIQSDQHKIVKLKPQKSQQGKYHLRQDCFEMKDSNFKRFLLKGVGAGGIQPCTCRIIGDLTPCIFKD